MNELSWMLSDKDLQFLIQVLMPGCKDRQRMVKILREDEDILRGMLLDKKLLDYLTDEQESLIKVSPHLFFTVLLERVKADLEHQSYTIERDQRIQMVVFDSKNVIYLLNEKKIIRYLTDMLVSFIRINNVTIPIRVKKGVWSKIRFSDFDVDSLIKYSHMIDENQRFGPYKRIADICLFITGIFPEYIEAQRTYSGVSRARLGAISQWSREGIEKYGKYFYKAAAQQKAAQLQELDTVLMNLSENFILATKPLSFMTRRYLGFSKDKFFLR